MLYRSCLTPSAEALDLFPRKRTGRLFIANVAWYGQPNAACTMYLFCAPLYLHSRCRAATSVLRLGASLHRLARIIFINPWDSLKTMGCCSGREMALPLLRPWRKALAGRPSTYIVSTMRMDDLAYVRGVAYCSCSRFTTTTATWPLDTRQRSRTGEALSHVGHVAQFLV